MGGTRSEDANDCYDQESSQDADYRTTYGVW